MQDLSLADFLFFVTSECDRFYSELKICSSKTSSEMVRTMAEDIRTKFLGRKGAFSSLIKLIPQLPSDDRAQAGHVLNERKSSLEKDFQRLLQDVSLKEQAKIIDNERVDVTLPGRPQKGGFKHPVMEALERALSILESMGFSVFYGDEITTEEASFDSLNFPKNHPARHEQDTYYLPGGFVLRTQTSSAQTYLMKNHPIPIRFVVPGKCFRNEEVSGRSLTVFHQVEGLYVDGNVRFGDLLSTLEHFFTSFLGSSTKLRFRPSYFPFVEPGIEVDIHCFLCNGNGCFTCKQLGWLEVAGAGMVHPSVIENGGLSNEKYSGFAWGFGLERLVLLLHGISDIRLLIQNPPPFLRQFS